MSRACLAALALLGIGLLPASARAAYECGGEYDNCDCGAATFCICDGTCGNCVWHAWHMACCGWGRALEWCTDAQYWNDQAQSRGYPTGSHSQASSIFVCEPSATCSEWGHVGWLVQAYADGSFDSTEQFWGGPCGTHDRHRAESFATGGFIYDPDGTQPGLDDASFVSETIPDGTHLAAGQPFTKRWTMRNDGDTTWTQADSYLWAFDGEQQFGAAEQTLLPAGASVAPGQTWDWDVPMVAPASAGTYRGYWRMDRYGTARFGDRVWVEIVVDPPADGDGDGYPAGEDCDDGDGAVHPGAVETCGDGRDEDCDGQTDEGCAPADGDGDGYPVGEDCDDGDGAVHPGAVETCEDGRDEDCDGQTDEGCGTGIDADGDGYPDGSDCDDADPDIHPGATELCGGPDSDCDGLVDPAVLEELCGNQRDDDCDGLVDEGCDDGGSGDGGGDDGGGGDGGNGDGGGGDGGLEEGPAGGCGCGAAGAGTPGLLGLLLALLALRRVRSR